MFSVHDSWNGFVILFLILPALTWTYKKLETVSKFEFGMIGILLGLLMQGENLFDDGFIAGTATFAKLWITYT